MIVLSLICALVAGRIWKDGGLFKLWSFAFASISVHVIFDLLNSYGAKPFWPFYDKWYALDSVFIIDPLITVPIIVAIVLMKLGRNRKVVFAALAAFMVFYIGGRVALHGYAVRHVMAANPEAISVGAFPSPFSPLKWRAVVEHPDGFVAGWYDLADGSVSGVEASLKPVDTDILSTAQEAKAVEVFLDFARFPLATVNEIPGGWEVSYTDLRFSFGPGDRRFIASVIVNDNMSHGPGDFKYSP
jgi:inner membrane protein